MGSVRQPGEAENWRASIMGGWREQKKNGDSLSGRRAGKLLLFIFVPLLKQVPARSAGETFGEAIPALPCACVEA